jgi:hypothetical protein
VTSIPPRQVAYLLDIYQSAQAIQSYVAGQTHEDFLKDPKTQDAVLRRFLVAGETIQAHLPLLFKELHPFFEERGESGAVWLGEIRGGGVSESPIIKDNPETDGEPELRDDTIPNALR